MQQSGRDDSQSLEFKAYRRDPLARLLIDRLEWPSWKFSSIYVTAYLASLGLAFLVYWLTDDGPNTILLGGVGALFALILVIIVTGGFGSGFYVYMSRRAGSLYQDLSAMEVIDSSNEGLRNLVTGELNSIFKNQDRAFWPWLAAAITIFLAATIVYFQGFYPGRTAETIARSTIVFATLPFWSLAFYMVGLIVARALVTIRGLYKVFRVAEVRVHPLHPDKCGGLEPLRN